MSAHEIDSSAKKFRFRVLLADDHKAILARVRTLLEPEFEVVGAVCDGQALVRAAEKLKPDVLVVDVSMPLLNGIEAVRQIMKTGSKARVIFISAHADSDILSLCFDGGALAFVVKSRLASDLIPATRSATTNHSFRSPTVPCETST